MNLIKRLFCFILIGGGLFISSPFIEITKGQDDFEEFEIIEETVITQQPAAEISQDPQIFTPVIILFWVILSGIAVRYTITRPLRGLSLLLGIIYFGFYRGGCPCMIMSFHKTIFSWFDPSISWLHMLWFLLLIPLSYLFGRVWCGWICHLGALQEFLHIPLKNKFCHGLRWQKILKYSRITIFILLTLQLIITKTNLWKEIDPFKNAFNLYAAGWLEWTLLTILLVSSLFIYRPFCRSICPIGLIMGWISKIPGASVIGNNGKCSGCKQCDNYCNIQAIVKTPAGNIMDNQECIACGKCLENCGKNALTFFRKGDNHGSLVFCRKKETESSCSAE